MYFGAKIVALTSSSCKVRCPASTNPKMPNPYLVDLCTGAIRPTWRTSGGSTVCMCACMSVQLFTYSYI